MTVLYCPGKLILRVRTGTANMPYVVFSIIGLLPLALLFALLNLRLDWPDYFIWLVSANVVTFSVYGLDKILSKVRWLRAPNITLHGLALVGGCLGGWAGRAVFNHKTNRERYPEYPMVLAASTLVHVAIIWYFFLRGG